MKTDLYTKIVLTVIAVALVANFFKSTDVVATAQAQNTTPAPAVAPLPQTIDVNIVSLDGMPVFLRYVNTTNAGKRALLPISIENTDTKIDVTMKKYEDILERLMVYPQ